MTSSDADVLYADLSETTATAPLTLGTFVVGAIVTIGATTTGPVNVTLTDSNGTSASLTGAFNITADPTVSAITISPGAQTTVAAGQVVVGGTATVTGTGFESGATVSIQSTVDGTTILSSAGTTFTNSTTLVISVTLRRRTSSSTMARRQLVPTRSPLPTLTLVQVLLVAF